MMSVWVRYAVALVWSALVTVALLQSSTQPLIGPAMPPEPPTLAREALLTLGHLVSFGGLTLLWYRALSMHFPPRYVLWGVVLAVTGYSFLTEYLQTFVVDRGASVYDLVVNQLAIFCAVWWIITRQKAV